MAAATARSARQRRLLHAMGILCWERRNGPESAVPVPDEQPATVAGPAAVEWDTLREAVAACRSCDLHRTRTRTVFGVGSPSPRWLVIGEAPGAEEDRQGEPFVGAAGQLLNEMLRAVGLARADVYIANILKCRPPDNRNPRPEEITACGVHLQAQLRLLAPRLILAVGRIAAQSLLQQEAPLGKLRGRAHACGEACIPLVVTYHPAYLLRSPAEKRKAWDDLRLARQLVDPRGS